MANLPVVLFQSLTTSSTDEHGHLVTFPMVSDKAKGCGYYGQSNPLHTISYATTMGFIGLIKLQGSLASDPEIADWYDIDGTTLTNGLNPVANGTAIINFNGNHVWIRSVISVFSAGQLNSVTLTHN